MRFTHYLATALIIFSDCIGAMEKLPEFERISFRDFGIRDDDHPGKLAWVTWSVLGGRILGQPEGAALILVKRQADIASSFSFSFDSRVILSHQILKRNDASLFLQLASNPYNYCPLDKVPDDIHPFRNDPADYAIELSADKAFVRMYFCPDIKYCCFKTSDGTQGKTLIMSPQLADEVKRLIKEFSEKSEDDSK
jgi:hypothetical protein